MVHPCLSDASVEEHAASMSSYAMSCRAVSHFYPTFGGEYRRHAVASSTAELYIHACLGMPGAVGEMRACWRASLTGFFGDCRVHVTTKR